MAQSIRVDDLTVEFDDGVELPQPERLPLGIVLRAVDLATAAVAAALLIVIDAALPPLFFDTGGLPVLALPPVALATLTTFSLYQRRRCAIASLEISRVGRSTVALAIGSLLLLQAADSVAPYSTSAILGLVVFPALVLGRTWYRHWLKQARLEGRFLTPVAVVGDWMTAQEFAGRLRANPDAGYVPVAHVDTEVEGDGLPLPGGAVVPRVGHVGDDLDALVDLGVRSAVVLTPNLGFGELNRTVRRLRRRFDHVQVVTSLAGVAHTRLVPTPLVDETTFYLEGAVSSTWQRAAKRATDILLASLLFVLFLPVMAAIAVAIKLTDPGPVLFGQERVGRGGGTITLWKFRSMVVDADKMLDQVRAEEGSDRSGPLFKAADDPRITRIGRILRASSLDELPQLWSIIIGDMSLVGPRPALPAEVADFDAAHRRRHEVRPGLTGLWQVEDRDHPDFERYRRHDVFYVENWSLSLDLAILLQTAATVVSRAVRAAIGNTHRVGA